MRVVGSILARLGSKRLAFKNLLPFEGTPMLVRGIQTLRAARRVDTIVVSTESELVARIAASAGAIVLRRPESLAEDTTPSVPVFQHLVEHFPCDVHVNLNVNFARCEAAVVDRAVELAAQHGESLSVPHAVWAQTAACLQQYGNPWEITATRFDDARAGDLDIHTLDDWLETHRLAQGELAGWDEGIVAPRCTVPRW